MRNNVCKEEIGLLCLSVPGVNLVTWGSRTVELKTGCMEFKKKKLILLVA